MSSADYFEGVENEFGENVVREELNGEMNKLFVDRDRGVKTGGESIFVKYRAPGHEIDIELPPDQAMLLASVILDRIEQGDIERR